ncbi:MAG: hypothetical protein ABJQ29_01200 [Luteolibacter sp.]
MAGIILSHLLDNAIAHSAPGSSISIELSGQAGHAEIATNPL